MLDGDASARIASRRSAPFSAAACVLIDTKLLAAALLTSQIVGFQQLDPNLGAFKDFAGTETGQRGGFLFCQIEQILCHARFCCFLSQTNSASMSSFCQLATSTTYGLTRRLSSSRHHCCYRPRPCPPLSSRPPTLILSPRVSNAPRPCKLQYES